MNTYRVVGVLCMVFVMNSYGTAKDKKWLAVPQPKASGKPQVVVVDKQVEPLAKKSEPVAEAPAAPAVPTPLSPKNEVQEKDKFGIYTIIVERFADRAKLSMDS